MIQHGDHVLSMEVRFETYQTFRGPNGLTTLTHTWNTFFFLKIFIYINWFILNNVNWKKKKKKTIIQEKIVFLMWKIAFFSSYILLNVRREIGATVNRDLKLFFYQVHIVIGSIVCWINNIVHSFVTKLFRCGYLLEHIIIIDVTTLALSHLWL